ncbi:MAG: LysM peptidoglycan-binding domain-containing protein [Betaproteobacteria bacterium]|nr:LysM peptidoglycan-binding domain-containing protein [Betaproteobacteria bacterium]
MKLIPLFLLMLIISLFPGCASKFPETVPVDNSKNIIQKCPDVYKVKKGDTIFSLSLKCGFDYKDVAAVNNIKKPYKVSVGEEIRFDLLRNDNNPEAASNEMKSDNVEIARLDDEPSEVIAEQKPLSQEDIGEPIEINEPVATREIYNSKSVQKTKEIVAKNTESLANRFMWPTDGEVAKQFNPDEGLKGILIEGSLGQEVKSIDKGRVIYAGEDLKGYGKLIIIKHDDDILSVYGHNRELLVTEGQKISAGEIISTMGETDDGKIHLHFEISTAVMSYSLAHLIISSNAGAPISPTWA